MVTMEALHMGTYEIILSRGLLEESNVKVLRTLEKLNLLLEELDNTGHVVHWKQPEDNK